MSAESPGRLVLELRASPALACVLVALHAGAAAIAAYLSLPPGARLALLGFVAVSLYRALRLHALRTSPRAVAAVAFDADGGCAVRARHASEWAAARLLDAWVHPRLTLLVLRGDRVLPLAVVIPADGVSAEAFRRLRVRLRLRTAAE